MVYINKAPLATTLVRDADNVAARAYRKIVPRTMETFLIIKVIDYTLLTNVNGITDTASVQQTTVAPGQSSASIC